MKPWVLPWVVAGWVLWALPVWGETVVQPEDEVSVLDPLVVTASRVSRARRPGRSAMAASRFTSDRWEICTPLGRPVEPEV